MTYLAYESIYQEEFQVSIFFLNIKVFLQQLILKYPPQKPLLEFHLVHRPITYLLHAKASPQHFSFQNLNFYIILLISSNFLMGQIKPKSFVQGGIMFGFKKSMWDLNLLVRTQY